MNKIVIIFAIAGLFIAWISYRIIHVMTSSEEYTERDDFGDGKWAKNCFETKEYVYLRKKNGLDFLRNIATECAMLISAFI